MCPEGTYQPLKGQFECLSCPTGYLTAERGTQDIANCILGKANNIVSAFISTYMDLSSKKGNRMGNMCRVINATHQRKVKIESIETLH